MKKILVCGNHNRLNDLKQMVRDSGHQLIDHMGIHGVDIVLQNFCMCCPLDHNVLIDVDEGTKYAMHGGFGRHHFVTTNDSVKNVNRYPWVVVLNSPDDLKGLLDSQ